MIPIVETHEGILVVRDDLYPGGTKARFIAELFKDYDELVYASPAEGGAQTAMAVTAKALGKRATIFVAKRAQPHPRTLEAKNLGAQILQVSPGYLSVVRARAKAYAQQFNAYLLPFGLRMDLAIKIMSDAARSIPDDPGEVWCAAGSGVLATALRTAFPKAAHYCVQVGHALTEQEVAGAKVWHHPLAFSKQAKQPATFPADPHYDAKAWQVCAREADRSSRPLFWNVAPLVAHGSAPMLALHNS